MKKLNRTDLILIVILIIGGVLRFYNHDWGFGNFFHPDERNIASAIASLDFANGDYNPNFFAYGSFPIYIVYLFSKGDFALSLLYGRLISAFLSTISLFLIFSISKEILTGIIYRKKGEIISTRKAENMALLVTLICAFSPGLIQFAHFTTFETFLLFEYLLFIFFSIKLLKHPTWSMYLLLGLITGLSVATKVVSIFLVVAFLGVHLLAVVKFFKPGTSKLKSVLAFFAKLISPKIICSLIVGIGVFLITNPFMLLDFESYKGSLDYESAVATGKQIVFYTQQFTQTTPFLYQFLYVFPSQVSWPVTIFGFLSFGILCLLSVKWFFKFLYKDRNSLNLALFVMIAVAMGYGILHFYMFVKWTRYMLPLLPFLVISMVAVLTKLSINRNKIIRNTSKFTLFVLAAFAILQGLNFFSIYLQPDPRLEAAQWLAEKSKPEDKFLGEVYDIGMTAFNNSLGSHKITEIDLYHIDDGFSDEQEKERISSLLSQSNFVIIPAERLYPTRARLSGIYPNGYEHYANLFEENGFKKVAEFNRDTYIERLLGIKFYSSNLFQPLNYDETFKIFDQPTITIFQKI